MRSAPIGHRQAAMSDRLTWLEQWCPACGAAPGAIALLGQLIPVGVRPDTESAGYLLYLQQAVIRSMGDHRWSLPSVPDDAAASTSDNPGCQRMSFLRA
jgi:hypothetical protein